MHYLLLCLANLGQAFRLSRTTFVKQACIKFEYVSKPVYSKVSKALIVFPKFFVGVVKNKHMNELWIDWHCDWSFTCIFKQVILKMTQIMHTKFFRIFPPCLSAVPKQWKDCILQTYAVVSHTFALSRLVWATYSHFRDLGWYVANSWQIRNLRGSTW